MDHKRKCTTPGEPIVKAEHVNAEEAVFYKLMSLNGKTKYLGDCTMADARWLEKHGKARMAGMVRDYLASRKK